LLPPPSAPPPLAPKQFTVDVRLQVAASVAAASLTAEQVIAAAMRLPADGDASSTVVSITQSWELGFAVDAGEDVTVNALIQATKLEAACRISSPDCRLARPVVSSRGRALQINHAVLLRLLTTGSLAAEIPNLGSSGVAVTTTSFNGVDVLLSVTKQGGAEEANALLDGSLAVDQVRATISADLKLAGDTLIINVQQRPIFPPMPPPSLPPSLFPPPPPPAPPLPSGDGDGSHVSNGDAWMDAGVLWLAGSLAAGVVLLCLLACWLWWRRRRQKGVSRSLNLRLGGAGGSDGRPSIVAAPTLPTARPVVHVEATVHSMNQAQETQAEVSKAAEQTAAALPSSLSSRSSPWASPNFLRAPIIEYD
jgi:hypothetical protein